MQIWTISFLLLITDTTAFNTSINNNSNSSNSRGNRPRQGGFITTSTSTIISVTSPIKTLAFDRKKIKLFQGKSSEDEDDEEDEEDDDEAFAAALSGLENLVGSLDDPPKVSDPGQQEKLEAMAKSLAEFSSSSSAVDKKGLEEELKMYKDMYSELDEAEGGGDTVIYDKLYLDLASRQIREKESEEYKSRMGGRDEEPKVIVTEKGSEDLVNKLIDEALEDLVEKNPDMKNNISIGNILEDEDLVEEINRLFDKASDDLASLAKEIKGEQAKANEEMEKVRALEMEKEKERIKEGEEKVSKMMERVDKEAQEVKKAIKDLEAAQKMAESDPLLKVINLRSAGIDKQGAFALSLFLLIRTLTDLAQVHLEAAGIQALIALVAAAYFFIF